MKSQTLESARLAFGSNVNSPLLAYFEERRIDLLDQLVTCGPDMFRQIQGRILECDETLKLIKSVR